MLASAGRTGVLCKGHKDARLKKLLKYLACGLLVINCNGIGKVKKLVNGLL
jgi:hypothetical protein